MECMECMDYHAQCVEVGRSEVCLYSLSLGALCLCSCIGVCPFSLSLGALCLCICIGVCPYSLSLGALCLCL